MREHQSYELQSETLDRKVDSLHCRADPDKAPGSVTYNPGIRLED